MTTESPQCLLSAMPEPESINVEGESPPESETTSAENAESTAQYLTYLGDLDPATPAVLTDDLRTTRGMLLLKKGAALNNKVTPLVVKHKLVKPIEDIIEIANGLDTDGLVECCADLLKRFSDLEQIMTDHGLRDIYPKMLAEAQIPHPLFQLLTVLRGRVPKVFEKALFCTLLVLLGAKELNYDEEKRRCAVLAALGHDIGFLYIDSTLLDKEEALTPTEWKKIQTHVNLSRDRLKTIDGLPAEALKAILEHHERCDGTGYPNGKRKQELGQIGQLIAVCDSLQAIRVNQFEQSNRNLGNAKPYLRLNAETYSHEVFQAMDSVLSKTVLVPVYFNPYESTGEFASHLSETALSMRDIGPALKTINRLVPNMKPGPNGEGLYNISTRLDNMMIRSGLFNEELLSWLGDSKANTEVESGLDELNNIDLMQNELRYQIGLMHKYMVSFMELECSKSGRSRVELREAQDIIGKCHTLVMNSGGSTRT